MPLSSDMCRRAHWILPAVWVKNICACKHRCCVGGTVGVGAPRCKMYRGTKLPSPTPGGPVLSCHHCSLWGGSIPPLHLLPATRQHRQASLLMRRLSPPCHQAAEVGKPFHKEAQSQPHHLSCLQWAMGATACKRSVASQPSLLPVPLSLQKYVCSGKRMEQQGGLGGGSPLQAGSELLWSVSLNLHWWASPPSASLKITTVLIVKILIRCWQK